MKSLVRRQEHLAVGSVGRTLLSGGESGNTSVDGIKEIYGTRPERDDGTYLIQ